ncbi:MAG: kelch repeat-containing protein [bacterium]|nr:kelch repeat-containing protein [bacterium]
MRRLRRVLHIQAPTHKPTAGVSAGLCLLGAFVTGQLRAQTDWQRAPLCTPRDGAAACYDASRQRTLFFGGQDGAGPLAELWEWDGANLVLRPIQSGPPPRTDAALAYIYPLQLNLLFGGLGPNGAHGDTWLFDGTSWIAGPANGPGPRHRHAMTFDPGTGVVLLVGGQTGQVLHGDTWSYDGTDWSLTTAIVTPLAGAGLATPAGGTALLFGGRDAQGLRDDLLRWSNGSWLATGATGPAAREDAIFVRDASLTGVLLAGGRDDLGARSDTWQFDGTSWMARTGAGGLGARANAGAAFDESAFQAVALGGSAGGTASRRGDLLAATGTGAALTWQTRRTSDTPGARSSHALAYDPLRERTVVFGGVTRAGPVLADTWEWDGSRWLDVSTFGPAPRQGAAMAWDDQRQRVVLFGGGAGPSPFGGTWEWDGTNWNQLNPAASPIGRQFHDLVPAPGGGLLLFGGIDFLQQILGDTWHWTGNTWQAVSGPAPSARRYHAMACDRRRGEVVLFGGDDGFQTLADTWTFDGVTWSPEQPANSPSPRSYAAMTYAAERDRVVVTGGLDPALMALDDTWEWRGGARTWDLVTTTNRPAPRFLARLGHHAATDTNILLGGTDGGTDFAATTTYRAAATASTSTFGSGCPASPPTVAPAPFSRPWLGSTFTIALDNLPPQPGFLIVVYGFSTLNWNGIPLPAPLDPYGLPGCHAWISSDEPFPVFHPGGSTTFSFPIPLLPSYAGWRYFNQVIAFDPSYGNPAGAAVSHAMRASIGLR